MILRRVEEGWGSLPAGRMPTKNNKIRETMFARADPVIFRGVAFALAVGVAGSDMLMAGAWWAILAAGAPVVAACFLFPATAPKDDFRKNALMALDAIRSSPVGLRVAFVIILILACSVLDFYGRFELGRQFNIFLIPIFLASLLFGLPLAILTWLLAFLAVYFCVIPPKYSLVIAQPKEFAELIKTGAAINISEPEAHLSENLYNHPSGTIQSASVCTMSLPVA